MTDWDDTLDALSATKRPAPVEHILWTLTKGGRKAEARVRPHPHGQELRFMVDDQLLWSEVYKPGRGALLGELAESKRIEFLERGWKPSD